MRWFIILILCTSTVIGCTEYYYGSLCESCSETTQYLMDHNVYGEDVHINKKALKELKSKFKLHEIPDNAQGLPILFQNGMYFTGDTAIQDYFNSSQTGNCSVIEAGVISLSEPVSPSSYVTLKWYTKQIVDHTFFFMSLLMIFIGTSFIFPVQQSSKQLFKEYAVLAPLLALAITIPSFKWLALLVVPAVLTSWYIIRKQGLHISNHAYLVGTLCFIAAISGNSNQFSYAMPSLRLIIYNLVTMSSLMLITYAVHEFIVSGKNEEDMIAEQVHLYHVGCGFLVIGILLLTQAL